MLKVGGKPSGAAPLGSGPSVPASPAGRSQLAGLALCAATSVGYACHLTMSLLVDGAGEGYAGALPGYALLIGLVKVIAMLLFAARVPGSLLGRPRALGWAMSAIMLSGALCWFLRGGSGAASAVFEALFVVLACVPALAWIESFCAIYRCLGPGGCLATSGLCYVVNSFFTVSLDALPAAPWRLAFMALAVAGSWLGLLLAARLLAGLAAATPDPPAGDGAFRPPLHLVVVILALGLTWKLTNRFIGQQGVVWGAGGFSVWGLALGGVLAGVILLTVPKGSLPGFGALLRWAIALTGISWLLAPHLVQSVPTLASALTSAAYVFQGALMPCLIAGTCCGRNLPPCPTAGLLLAIFRAGGFLGIVLQVLLGTVGPVEDTLQFLSLAAASALFLLVPFVPSRVAGAEVLSMEHYPEELDSSAALKNVVRAITAEAALTGRESDVLLLLLQGKKREEVADELGISPWTVKKHMSNIFDKTGLRSVPELMAHAASWRGRAAAAPQTIAAVVGESPSS